MVTDTRDRILDAAELLFYGRGIAVTGVDRVAAEAGVAIATLYKQFGSKDGLLEAVLTRRLAAWTTCWDSAIEAARTPRERLLALFEALELFRSTSGSTQWCCFLATASERPHSSEDPLLVLVRQDSALLTSRLRGFAEEAGLADPDLTADRLLLIYNGALASVLRGSPVDPLATARSLAAAVVSNGH